MKPERSAIPLTADIVFKYVFGNRGSETILRSLLSALDDPALVMSDELLIHTIELPKLSIRSTGLERWGYYLSRRGSENAMEDPILLRTLRDDPEIQNAEERYRQFMADPQLESRYRARQRFLHQQATNLEEAREEGRREQLRETARKMKAAGIEVAVIQSVTGLTPEEIGSL